MTVVFPDRRLMDNNILHAQYWDHGLVLIHTKTWIWMFRVKSQNAENLIRYRTIAMRCMDIDGPVD